MKIFLAGIIQGSIVEEKIHTQNYRNRLKNILTEALPDAQLFCPIENHPNSLGYSFDKGNDVFRFLIGEASDSDVLLAFVPEASMGTAIEMWEAHKKGKLVIAISPMRKNWAVKYLSHHIIDSLEDFEQFARTGELKKLIAEHYGSDTQV